ncbi:MAG: sigma-70 family RNA polymerase sigma factor, partial [Gaiellaceae bacterium]
MASAPARLRCRPRRRGPSPPHLLSRTLQADQRTCRLVERAKQGDHEAKHLLVQEHMGLVAAVARRYRDLGVPDEDLRQEGAIGLLEAIDRFDPTIGATFATYARWRVRQSISHALSNRGRLLRLPKEITERRRLIARSTSALVGGGATPTAGEIAECTGLSKAQVVEALEA